MKRYQIFWKDNDRPVDDFDVVGSRSDSMVPNFARLICADDREILINLDEVRMIVVEESL